MKRDRLRLMPRAMVVLAAVAYCGLALVGAASAQEPSLAEARQLELTGKYAEAAAAFEKLAAQDPVAAAEGISRCLIARGKYDEAARQLAAALEKNSESARLYARAAKLAYRVGDLELAHRHIEAALKQDKNQPLARFVKAQWLRDTGQLDEAQKEFEWFIDFYNRQQKFTDPDVLRLVLLASAEYFRWHPQAEQFGFLVNDLKREQLKLEKNYWPAHYEAGLLYAEKFNEAQATAEFSKALTINPNAAEVHAAVALLHVEGFNLEDGKRYTKRALELNPRLVDAYLAEADIEQANFRVREAIASLEKALEINPVREDTLGRLAGCYVILDGMPQPDDESRLTKLIAQVTQRNLHCGTFYLSLGHVLDRRRRFADAEVYYQKAIEAHPKLIGPRSALGMLLMRMGEEDRANELLTQSFELDAYNVRVHNTLKVLDVLEEYETLKSDNFVIKYSGEQDKLLARYAAKYLEEQYPKLCEQFDFQVPEPSLFEIFSKSGNTKGHGWFSARMVGLPYLGTVGACAGKMVAIASPNEQPYNWSRVLKHEFIHVINLQQTNFNLPHWFAEGLAVINEGYPRPQIWNQLLLERVPAKKLFTLEDINFGFIRPQSQIEWQLAYCQSELYVEFMFHEFGDDAAARLLAAYADNLETPQAIQKAFGIDWKEFDQRYLKYVEGIVDQLQAAQKEESLDPAAVVKAAAENPDNADHQARLALLHLARKQYPEARKAAKRAFELKEGHQLAAYVTARVYLVIGENELATKLCDKHLDRENPNLRLLALLAALKVKAKDYEAAEQLYQLGAKKDPAGEKWNKFLAKLYLTTDDNDKLVPALAKIAERDADNYVIRKKLAQLAMEREDWPAAARWCYEAIYINVLDPQVHQWLGKALVQTNQKSKAIEEYEVSLELLPNQADVQLALAKACIEAKQNDKAKTVLEALLENDPSSEEGKKLLESLKQ